MSESTFELVCEFLYTYAGVCCTYADVYAYAESDSEDLLVLTKQRFRECGKANAYSANIEFHFNAHGEDFGERKAPTENSNR